MAFGSEPNIAKANGWLSGRMLNIAKANSSKPSAGIRDGCWHDPLGPATAGWHFKVAPGTDLAKFSDFGLTDSQISKFPLKNGP